MHFDLYGNRYKTAQEAANAEMAQCNEITNDLLQKEVMNLKRQIAPQDHAEDFHNIWECLKMLEGRIKALELKNATY